MSLRTLARRAAAALCGCLVLVAAVGTASAFAPSRMTTTTFGIVTISPSILVNPSLLTVPSTTSTTTTTTTTTSTSTTIAGPGPTSGAGLLGGTVRSAEVDDADDGMPVFVYVALGAAVVLVAAGGIILGRARASGD